MKRFLKIAALVVVVLVLVLGTLLAVTFMGRRPLTDGQEVGGGLRMIADGFSGIVMIPVGDGDVALIDAGNDQNGEAIKSELSRRQLTPDSVTVILLTHGHPDHIGAIKAFPKAQVMALQTEVPLIEGRAGARGPLPRMFPVSPTGISVTRALTDGEVVTVGNVPIRVYAVPGHTTGSAAYVVNGVVMVGDSADIASDGSLQGAPWLFSDSQSDNRASLVRLEQRLTADGTAVTAIVPSHSGMASGLMPLSEFVRRNE